MIRGDNIVCGTSTTGTGTLTLAACPTAVGGVDFDVFARATGIGFVNSAAVLVSYTIIEYTDTTFASPLAHEKGVGTLALGGSSGIANCTLARTTKQTSATSLNSQPATQNIIPATGISVGTAANTLVFIGASAADIPAFEPYVNTTSVDSNWGSFPLCLTQNSALAANANMSSGQETFIPFIWVTPMLVKRATSRLFTAYSGGSPVSNATARLYAIGSDGRPGKLLLDLGIFGSANTSLNSSGNITTAVHANGYFLQPGEYYFAAAWIFSGGSTPPAWAIISGAPGHIRSGRMGAATGAIVANGYNTSGVSTGAAPDTATLTSWGVDSAMSSTGRSLYFGLSAT